MKKIKKNDNKHRLIAVMKIKLGLGSVFRKSAIISTV